MKRSYLKMRRKALHKTLEDIAYDIGVSYNYLMVKIAKAYQMDINEFYHQECLYQKEKGVLKDYD
jgi:cytoskeletal protein RodZ